MILASIFVCLRVCDASIHVYFWHAFASTCDCMFCADHGQLTPRVHELEHQIAELQLQVCTNPSIHDEIHDLQDRFDELVMTHGKQGAENRALKKRLQEFEGLDAAALSRNS